jgi:hypothetical protein
VSRLRGRSRVRGPRPTPYVTILYPDALAYLTALVRAQAPLREAKALASTGIAESHRRGLTDSIAVFPSASLTRRDAEVWLRQIGQAA